MLRRLVFCLALATLSLPLFGQPFVTNFDQFAPGTAAESLNVPGVTFRGNPPGSWVIFDTFFGSLTGRVLFLPLDFYGSLDITFAAPVPSVSFLFAQNRPPGQSKILVESFSGDFPVGSQQFGTTDRGSSFGEGSVLFQPGQSFNRIHIGSVPADIEIAIDNLQAPAGSVATVPVIRSFTASPSIVRPGQPVTLLFSTSGATSVSIDNGVGSHPASGSVVVNPTVTTTYTLTAFGSGGNSTAQVRVEVLTAPEVVISSLPAALVQGTSAGGATSTYVVSNVGGQSTQVNLTLTGNFFTQAPTSFTLAPGASQVVTLTGLLMPTGSYRGSSNLAGNGVPTGLAVPVTMLAAPTPTGPTAAAPVEKRVDVAAVTGQNPTGSVVFTNTASAQILASVVADVPWIILSTNLITINPGQSVTVNFTIDRAKRAEATREFSSATGTISLVFRQGPSAKITPLQGGVPSSTTKVTVVDTVQPPVTTTTLQRLDQGQVAFILPGVGQVTGSAGVFLSDLSIVNLTSSENITDLRFLYTPFGGTQSTTFQSSVSSLTANEPLAVGNVVKSVFSATEQIGSLQVRTSNPDKVAVSANIFNASNPAGTFGTAIPAFRSDRSIAANGRLFITGLRKDDISHTNIYIQEMFGDPADVRLDFLNAQGVTIGTRNVTIGGFQMARELDPLPAGSVSAVITNLSTSAGRIQAYATPVERPPGSGDTWALADWNSLYGFVGSAPMLIPIAGAARGALGTDFRTDLAIMNTHPSLQGAGQLDLFLNTGQVHNRTISVGPMQTTVLTDLTASLFGLAPPVLGYIVFTPISGSFVMSSRNYTVTQGSPKTFGTAVPTLPIAQGLKLGETRRIGGLDDASLQSITAATPGTFRTNFAVMNTSGDLTTVRVTLTYTYASAGKASLKGTASQTYSLLPREFRLISNLARTIIGPSREQELGDLHNLQVDFSVISGTGAINVFVSSVDNGSADSILRTD